VIGANDLNAGSQRCSWLELLERGQRAAAHDGNEEAEGRLAQQLSEVRR
jgi:hypothetical protein